MSNFSHPFDRKITQAAQKFHLLQMETWIAWAQIMLVMADDVRFGNPHSLTILGVRKLLLLPKRISEHENCKPRGVLGLCGLGHLYCCLLYYTLRSADSVTQSSPVSE
jgi:hypothetical protein